MIGQDCVGVGYKYEPTAIVTDWYTSNKQNFTLLAIYFSVSDFAIFFFFREFFQADQGRLTFERLGLLVSFRLPSKSKF